MEEVVEDDSQDASMGLDLGPGMVVETYFCEEHTTQLRVTTLRVFPMRGALTQRRHARDLALLCDDNCSHRLHPG